MKKSKCEVSGFVTPVWCGQARETGRDSAYRRPVSIYKERTVLINEPTQRIRHSFCVERC